MKSQSYMTRALKARDPRFALILDRLGYSTADLKAEKPQVETKPKPQAKASDLTDLRTQYAGIVGKRPFNGWDAATLTQKIAEHRAKG